MPQAIMTEAGVERSDAPPVAVARAAPPLALRLVVAVALGLVVGALVHHIKTRMPADALSSDFQAMWFVARAFWSGRPAYEAIGPEPFRDLWWNMRSGYPATAFVVLGPLTRLSLHQAESVFAGVGTALLALTLTRRSWAPLVILGSWPVHFAIESVQWSPATTAAAVYPALAWLVVAKPTIGLAATAYGISARWLALAMLGGFAVAGVAWAVDPHWIASWWASVHAPAHPSVGVAGSASLAFVPMVALPGGVLALLALLRWRRPEARLLAVFACVPHTLSGYELVLLLALIPETLVEATVLALLSWALAAVLATLNPHPDLMTGYRLAGIWSVVLVVVPCTIIVLRRPNEGVVPAWLERIAARASLPGLRRHRV